MYCFITELCLLSIKEKPFLDNCSVCPRNVRANVSLTKQSNLLQKYVS